MTIASGSHRSIARFTQSLVASLTIALVGGPAHAAQTLPERLQAARAQAGVDPRVAREALAALRNDAVQAGRLDWRLSIDEVDCRVLTDMDEELAASVAQAGLRSAGNAVVGPARLPWLRLRACLAGAKIDNGDAAGGRRELDQVLAESAAEDLQQAHALALLERGVQDSRSGELLRGQQELLSACDAMAAPGQEADLELCLGHLANHYKRMGEFDEAQRLLVRLRDEARSRGAVWDIGVYTFALAQVHFTRNDLPDALMAFQEALDAYLVNGDHVGQIYAEYGLAATLLHTGRPAEALPHVDRSLQLLETIHDAKQVLRCSLVRAELLTALGRAVEAEGELHRIEVSVRAQNEDLMMADWLRNEAEVQGQLSHWHEAYLALRDWRVIDARVQAQRQSEQAARLRLEFNRVRDIKDLESLRQLNEQGQKLHRTETAALAFFVLLLMVSLVYAQSKFRLARRLQALASTDELTGLPNRRAVLAYAETAQRQAARDGGSLSVLMVDVDRFKSINDKHGHAIGDDVLRHLARVLPTGLRGHDRLGRIGGEEFAVILPGASLDQAAQIAERMRDTIAATPLITAVGELRFTVSIGVAAMRSLSDSIPALLERADAALYQAKDGGRNAVVLDSDQPRARDRRANE